MWGCFTGFDVSCCLGPVLLSGSPAPAVTAWLGVDEDLAADSGVADVAGPADVVGHSAVSVVYMEISVMWE